MFVMCRSDGSQWPAKQQNTSSISETRLHILPKRQMPFLPPNQQHQSTEGTEINRNKGS